MACERLDEFVLEIGKETAFEDGGASHSTLAVHNVDLSSVDYEWIEDQTYSLDGGTHERIQGLSHPNVSVTYSAYPHGQATAAGNGVAATAVGFEKALAACAQSTPVLTTGSTVSSGTTASTVEVDAGNHDPSGNTYGIAGVVQDDASIDWRPYTYNTATLTYNIVLSAAPTAANVIYGAANIAHAQSWSGAAGYSVGQIFVGNDTNQHRKLLGSVMGFEIPATAAGAPPVFNFTAKAASFSDLFADTRAAPSYNRNLVLAGGSFLMAAAGVGKTPTAIQLYQIQFSDNGGYLPDQDANDPSSGIGGWCRPKASPELRLTVPHDQALPAGPSSTTFRDALRTGGSTENEYQFLAVFGRSAGSTVCLWCPRWRIVKVETPVEFDEHDAQTLVLQPVASATEGIHYLLATG